MKKVFIYILFLFNILLYSKTFDESLFSAVENNNIEKVKSYLDKGANPNARNEYGLTVLMYAAVSGNYEMVKFLLENGADVNTKDNDGNTVLYYNIYYDHYGEEEKLENAKKIFNLLIKYGADVNTKDNDGASLLDKSYRTSTALSQNREMFKVLVENGFDLESRIKGGEDYPPDYDYTPLMIAALRNDYDMVKFLVSKNANINAQDNKGDTALNKTLDTSDEGSIDILDFEIANFLIEQGADVNIKNKREYTPLIYLGMGEGNFNNKSFQEYRIKLAEVLLEKGADINAQDYNGYTSLIWACTSSGSRFAEPYVKFLVEKGADVNIEDKHGDTALDMAEYFKLRKIAGILKKAQRNRK